MKGRIWETLLLVFLQEIQWISLRTLKEKLEKSQKDFYPMHIYTLKKYLEMKNM